MKKRSRAKAALPSASPSTSPAFMPVGIPTCHAFVKQWHQWIHKRVAQVFKRNKERIPDTVQRVRCRLLEKDAIFRWFFKHLKDELVDRPQAERILRIQNICFIGALPPAVGTRKDPATALWRISDLLAYAKYDHERYHYRAQDHTIDSDKALWMLGYPAGDYTPLQSMWRQGRIQPAELTQHECRRRGQVGAKPSECPECVRGLALLKARGASLAHDWTTSEGRAAAAKMRWNDSQFTEYLRFWRNMNRVYDVPAYIMRPVLRGGMPMGIDAGLLKYVHIIIKNEVVNEFKRLTRQDDLPRMVLNDGLSPGDGLVGEVAFDSDGEEGSREKVVCDGTALQAMQGVEHRSDVEILLSSSNLSEEELDAVRMVDLMEMTVKQFAESKGVPVQKAHRIRTEALRKMRESASSLSDVTDQVARVCDAYDCSPEDLFGSATVGSVVRARTDFFGSLAARGVSVHDMAARFSYPEERVAAAVHRWESRQAASPAPAG